MVRAYNFKQIDVFTDKSFCGNPVAVVFGAVNLDPQDMQQIASWTNLSETTFILPATSPKADYLLRIFAPGGELPFAGHPTIGSAHAILESDMVDSNKSHLVQECLAGLINLEIDTSGERRKILATVPPPQFTGLHSTTRPVISTCLGTPISASTDPLRVNVGPEWLIVNLEEAELVHQIEPNIDAIHKLSIDLGINGVTIFGFTGNKDLPVYVRSFAPASGVAEDPVCGSGNASVAAYLLETGLLEKVGYKYIANQGKEMCRDGFVHIKVDVNTGDISIGGSSITCIEGHITI